MASKALFIFSALTSEQWIGRGKSPKRPVQARHASYNLAILAERKRSGSGNVEGDAFAARHRPARVAAFGLQPRRAAAQGLRPGRPARGGGPHPDPALPADWSRIGKEKDEQTEANQGGRGGRPSPLEVVEANCKARADRKGTASHACHLLAAAPRLGRCRLPHHMKDVATTSNHGGDGVADGRKPL